MDVTQRWLVLLQVSVTEEPQGGGGVLKQRNPSEDMIIQVHSSATVFASDLANFTRYSSQEAPEFIISMVSAIFDRFDQLAEQHGLVRVKLIGAKNPAQLCVFFDIHVNVCLSVCVCVSVYV